MVRYIFGLNNRLSSKMFESGSKKPLSSAHALCISLIIKS